MFAAAAAAVVATVLVVLQEAAQRVRFETAVVSKLAQTTSLPRKVGEFEPFCDAHDRCPSPPPIPPGFWPQSGFEREEAFTYLSGGNSVDATNSSTFIKEVTIKSEDADAVPIEAMQVMLRTRTPTHDTSIY